MEFLPAKSSRFWLRHFWFRWYWLNHPSTFYRKALFDEIGPVDVRLHYAMDYDFYLRASQRFEFYDIDLLTTRMRVHPDAKTSHGWDNFAADVQRTLAKVWKPRHPLFYAYSLLGVRMYAAQSHLVESFIGLREGRRRHALRELGRAAAWWPLLPLLPAFYSYCGRAGLAAASRRVALCATAARTGATGSEYAQPGLPERIRRRVNPPARSAVTSAAPA